MKAARFHEPGGPEKLVYEDAPDPHAGEGEIVVAVKACALNHVDLWALQGGGNYACKLPHILGSDIAGEVVEIGPCVTGVAVGDRVVIDPGLKDLTCDYCLAGEESECVNFGIIGVRTDGGYGEMVAVAAANAVPIPDDVSFVDIAAVPVVFTTAWHMLITRARLRLGETVLILAAGSGIGSAAVQIAKLAGAHVIAAAGSDEKLAKATDLGADEVINYTNQDFQTEVMRLTGGRGVDIVFENTGADTFDKSLKSLARNGRLVTAGATTGATAQIDILYLYRRQLSIIGSMLGNRRELHDVVRLVGQGKLKPVVDRVMPLREAGEALRLLKDRKQFGKIVLQP
jgi:NADPH:quinone reductase-like Zn-dependent oxidoreductase